MNREISGHLKKFDALTVQRFHMMRKLIFEGASEKVEEKLWAKLPSYYVGDQFVRLIPFSDHINIQAKAVSSHIQELSKYKITPKGMLQVFHHQPIPAESLKAIFMETLTE